jgi:hypothetical protein
VIGSVTIFDDPLQRIRLGQIARVPILLGSLESDGAVDALVAPGNLSAFLAEEFGPLDVLFSPALVQALYPGLNDTQVIAAAVRDILVRW